MFTMPMASNISGLPNEESSKDNSKDDVCAAEMLTMLFEYNRKQAMMAEK